MLSANTNNATTTTIGAPLLNSIISVELDSQPIELCKLLKIANVVGGGGEAKIVISEGYVILNGEVETQKRKKIVNNDVIEFNGDIIEVSCSAPILEANSRPIAQPAPIKKRQSTAGAPQQKKGKQSATSRNATTNNVAQGRRKKISF